MKSFKEIFIPVISLFLICAVAAGLLAATNDMTKNVIIDNENKTIIEGYKKLIPDAVSFEDKIFSQNETNHNYVTAYSSDKEEISDIFVTTAKGYGGDVTVMTAVSPDATVIAVSVVSLSETPGLGMKVNEKSFLSRFAGKTKDIKVNSENNSIDAISGATISSNAVTNAVNKALSLHSLIRGLK